MPALRQISKPVSSSKTADGCRPAWGEAWGAGGPATRRSLSAVFRYGAEAFRATGTADASGTKLFSVSGRVERPGLYDAVVRLLARRGFPVAREPRAVSESYRADPAVGQERKYTISGFLREMETGESIIAAYVQDRISGRNTKRTNR